MYQALLVVFLLIALSLVILIMLQQGKGADIRTSFSAGISGTLFGLSDSSNSINRMTAVLATLFFIFSLVLSNLNSNYEQKNNQQDNVNQLRQDNKTLAEASIKLGNNDIPQ